MNAPLAIPVDHAQAANEVLHKINLLLLRIVGTSSSIRTIAKALPSTGLHDASEVHPELIFPVLATGMIDDAEAVMDCIEDVEMLVKQLASEAIQEPTHA